MKTNIKTKVFVGLCLSVALVAFPASAQVDTYKHTLSTTMTGNEEVSAVSTNATGDAVFHVGANEDMIHYVLNVYNGNDVTMAHLHCGRPGESGPDIVPLYTNSAGADVHGQLASGTIIATDLMTKASTCNPNIQNMNHLIQAMREGTIYVNVHTAQHPQGELRGQVRMGGGHVIHTAPAMTMNTTTPPTDTNNDTTDTTNMSLILISDDLIVHEMMSTDADSRTFMITISTSLLDRIHELFMQFVDFVRAQNIQIPGWNMEF
ncbi:MAG TPA: CHRD domain-containing protein [Candidatus Kapabacteria bacterium]|nr:CHRD domain-containing protein [Candidatus Kapabacteria bacterium]